MSVCVCAEDGSEEKINEHLALCVKEGDNIRRRK